MVDQEATIPKTYHLQNIGTLLTKSFSEGDLRDSLLLTWRQWTPFCVFPACTMSDIGAHQQQVEHNHQTTAYLQRMSWSYVANL